MAEDQPQPVEEWRQLFTNIKPGPEGPALADPESEIISPLQIVYPTVEVKRGLPEPRHRSVPPTCGFFPVNTDEMVVDSEGNYAVTNGMGAGAFRIYSCDLTDKDVRDKTNGVMNNYRGIHQPYGSVHPMYLNNPYLKGAVYSMYKSVISPPVTLADDKGNIGHFAGATTMSVGSAVTCSKCDRSISKTHAEISEDPEFFDQFVCAPGYDENCRTFDLTLRDKPR
jgi:hypothetical protein